MINTERANTNETNSNESADQSAQEHILEEFYSFCLNLKNKLKNIQSKIAKTTHSLEQLTTMGNKVIQQNVASAQLETSDYLTSPVASQAPPPTPSSPGESAYSRKPTPKKISPKSQRPTLTIASPTSPNKETNSSISPNSSARKIIQQIFLAAESSTSKSTSIRDAAVW